jgi:hypothetical protein
VVDAGGSGITETSSVFVNVYPNPANSLVRVNASSTIERVRMINALGQVVISENGTSQNHAMNVSQLDNGLYMVEVTTAKGTSTSKLFIAR